jgi:hypothetical protein
MTRQQSRLLGQVLRIYLNQIVFWVRQLDRKLNFSIVDEDGRRIEQYILNALSFGDNILCTSKGITALVAVDRATQALRCSLCCGRCLGHNSPEYVRKAGSLYRTSAYLAVNMMIAEIDGEAELAELWGIARELLDTFLNTPNEIATALSTKAVLVLPSHPAKTLSDYRNYVWLREFPTLKKAAVCIERKLWACDVITTIVAHFKDLLPASAQSAEQAFRNQKRIYSADAVRRQLEAFYTRQASLCGDETSATILVDCMAQLSSTEVQSDLQSLLAALLETAHYSTLMGVVVTECASPFWYMRARESIAEKLRCMAAAVSGVGNLLCFESPGLEAQLFVENVQDQYAAIVSVVQASQLFAHPTGNLKAEYDMLCHGTRLISSSAVQDWASYEHCAAKATSATAQRGCSAAHALAADCWTQASAALYRCLCVGVHHAWDAKAVSDIIRRQAGFWESAIKLARLAEGLVPEVNRLNTAATNSASAGRLEAAQLRGEAADMQVQIATRLHASTERTLRGLIGGGETEHWYIDYPDALLQQMVTLLNKVTQLAQRLDSVRDNSSAQASGTATVTTVELLKYSVEHSRVCCAYLQVEGSPLAHCASHHRDLERLHDTFLTIETRATFPAPTALMTRLAALSALKEGSSAAVAPAAGAIVWLPACLAECSAQLLSATSRTDLGPLRWNTFLECIDHFTDTVRPILASIAGTTYSTGDPSSHTTETTVVAGRLCTAYLRASSAILDHDMQRHDVCMKAAEHCQKAHKLLSDNHSKSYCALFEVLVADRLLADPAVTSKHTHHIPAGGFVRASVSMACAPSVERIVQLIVQTTILDAAVDAASGTDDKTLPEKLLDLRDQTRAMYQLAIHDEYELARLRLNSSGDAKVLQGAIGRLERHSALARQCGRCYHAAAQALAKPRSPAALIRSLQGLARIAQGRLNHAHCSRLRRIGMGRLGMWFNNAAAAVRRDPNDGIGEAWLMAAEKGEEVCDGEVHGVDAGQLNAGAAVALCLQDIAVSTAAQQIDRALRQRAMLELLRIVEQCLIFASAASGPLEVNRLYELADITLSRVEQLVKMDTV